MTNPTPDPRPFVRKFNPVVLRHRNDGWTPEKQAAFIEALAESACVIDSCRRVGMSTESAYALRRRYDAVDFRLSWDAALEYAVQRLSEAALSRAIHGVAVPHYYKGQIVGEHRRFNEALTMFLLRYRDPARYARHWDKQGVIRSHPEEDAETLAGHVDAVRVGASDAMHEYENGVIEKVAVIATDAELDRLADIQAKRGVPAAVEEALCLLGKFKREADAEERAWWAAHDASAGVPGEPGMTAEDATAEAAVTAAATEAAAAPATAATAAAPADPARPAQAAMPDAEPVGAAAAADVAAPAVMTRAAAVEAYIAALARSAPLDELDALDAVLLAMGDAEQPRQLDDGDPSIDEDIWVDVPPGPFTPREPGAFRSGMPSTSSTSEPAEAKEPPVPPVAPPSQAATDPPPDPQTGPASRPWYPLPTAVWPPTRMS